MENGDRGLDAFKENRIKATYKIKRPCINLEDYDTDANREVIEEITSDPEHVDISQDGKVLWKGRTDKDGYALINTKILPDRPEGDNGRVIRLHRLLQQMFNNGAPVNAYVSHRDDNPFNISPSNLFQATAANNSMMIGLHNRRIYPKGEEHWCCKLTESQIVDIIRSHYSNEKSDVMLADEHGISKGYISRIVNGHVRQEITLKAIRAEITKRIWN